MTMHRVNARTPWSKLYGDLWRHPKWLRLSKGARALWTSALSWVSETRSFGDIPAPMLVMWQGTEEEATELVEVGLWAPTPDGWAMNDWDDHQTPREKFEETSKNRSEAGRKGGKASASKRSATSGVKQTGSNLLSKLEATAKQDAKQTRSNGEADIDVDADVDGTTPPNPPSGGVEGPELFELEEPKPARRASGVYSDDFEAAWQAFPVDGRKAKKVAAEAYDKARERADAATILAGVERYAEYVERTDVKVKYMQGWLNADRWTDENVVQPYRNGFNRPSVTDNVAAARDVAAHWAQQGQQEVSAEPNRRLSA